MNIQANSPVIPQNQTPVNKAATPQAPAASEQTSQLKNDVLEIDVKRVGRGALSLAGGAGAGILSGSVATTALVIGLERGIPKNMGGYVAAGGLLIGGAGGAAGALASTLLTDDAKTGAVVGGVAGAATGAALGKVLGTKGAMLCAAVGAVAGAAGGWSSAKIRE